MGAWNLTGTTASAPRGTAKDALSVTQAVELAAGALDALPQITMLGEVTGFRGPNARSGHCYFQIKDDSSAVDCIVWRGVYAKCAFELRDGMQVLLTGGFNLYKPTGRMSFVARSLALAGEGLLRQQVAALAEKLRREGLMDDARKRRIPAFCTRVAVVTSLSGAVIDDVKRTLRRRNPLVELVCVGAKVQGDGAPAELIEGLARAAALDLAPDCILLVRGGGSFEDLMTFNDEELARAVAACPVPVITGIGHEPDTSICDMVSDRRCSTPTAAAESVAPAITELAELLATRERRLATATSGIVQAARRDLVACAQRARQAISATLAQERRTTEAFARHGCLTSPGYIVERRASELVQTADRFERAGVQAQERFARAVADLATRLRAASASISAPRPALELAASRLDGAGESLLAGHRAGLAAQAAKLDALSPLKVLARGYAIAYDERGVATSAKNFAPGDALRVRFGDGEVAGTVTGVVDNG